MPDRRDFIRAAVAVTAAAASLRGGFAAAHRQAALFRILNDRGTRAGAAFGAEAARRGVPVSATGRDLGHVWMHEIEPRWLAEPAAIAGLTTGAALFCLEYLARDYGLELVYRIEHAALRGDRFRHAVTGPAELSDWTDRLAAAGAGWPAMAATFAVEFREGLRPQQPIPLLDLAECKGHAGEQLYSWLLAPRRKVPGTRSIYRATGMTRNA